MDGIFPNIPNIGNNMNISPLDSLSSKSAALKSAFKSSTNTTSSNYPQNILNHPNITTLIPGIGGYQYEVEHQMLLTHGLFHLIITIEKHHNYIDTYSNFRRWINNTTPDYIPPTKQLKPNGNSFSIMKVANGKILATLLQIRKEHSVQLQVQELQALLARHLLRKLKVSIFVLQYWIELNMSDQLGSRLLFLLD